MAETDWRPCVLIADSDSMQARRLYSALNHEGFTAIEAHDGDEAVTQASARTIDAIIVDSILAAGNKFAVCRRLRNTLNDRHVPIVIMIPKGQQDACTCQRGGLVDDCIIKPFSMSELIARLRSVMTADKASLAPEILRYADVTLDLGTWRLQRGERSMHLTPTEIRLLRFFLQHPRRVFSREQLLEAVWHNVDNVEVRTVDVHIRRLRKAMNASGASNLIRTIYKAGYAMDSEPRPPIVDARTSSHRRSSRKRQRRAAVARR